MIKIRPFIITAAFCLGILLSTGGAGACSPQPADNPRETVINAYKHFDSLKSYHMTIDLAASLSYLGKSMSITVNNEADAQVKPLLIRNSLTGAFAADTGKKELKAVQYMQQVGDRLAVYTNSEKRWSRQILPFFYPPTDYSDYLKAIARVKPVRDTSAETVYEVTISWASIRENIEKALASADPKEKALLSGLTKDLGDFTYTLTIDKKTATISRIDIDLSGLLVAIGKSIVETLNMPAERKAMLKDTLNSVRLTAAVKFSRIDAVEPIAIPEEALDAPLQTAIPQPGIGK